MSYFAHLEDIGASGIFISSVRNSVNEMYVYIQFKISKKFKQQKSFISLYKIFYGLTYKELKTHLLLFIIQ